MLSTRIQRWEICGYIDTLCFKAKQKGYEKVLARLQLLQIVVYLTSYMYLVTNQLVTYVLLFAVS